eukprot:SAG22_NODE_19356_length_275_cov_2.357955_2_plen_38_part_01
MTINSIERQISDAHASGLGDLARDLQKSKKGGKKKDKS